MPILKRSEKASIAPSDEPRVGFVAPTGPPVWWQEAFKIAVVIFLIVIALTIIRNHLQSLQQGRDRPREVDTPIISLMPTSPYRPESMLTAPPFESVNIIASASGVMTESMRQSLATGDVLYLQNQDTIDRVFVVNGTPLTLMPYEVHAYTVGALPQITVAVLDANRTPVRVFTFLVQ